ncbi:hypothetical protein GJ496_007769 [Pomphorhynchus laevis]|nr:hypothetical protein GJ496_007769 [Pomphorhynchus laevis]
MINPDRGFGSFFSSNVDQFLSSKKDDDSISDEYLQAVTYYSQVKDQRSRLIEALFPTLRQDVAYLNHGAFGLTLGRTLNSAHYYQNLAEVDPCRFYDRCYLPLACSRQKLMAKFLKCDCKSFVFVQNVSTAISSVFYTMQLKYRPLKVLCLSCTYGSTMKLLKSSSINDNRLISPTIINIDAIEDSDQSILDIVTDALENCEYHLAIFDHITSQHARTLPILDLHRICRAKNVITLVDGAHTLGTIMPRSDIIFTDLADFYITSGHKWLCGHKGVALLFFNPNLDMVSCSPISVIRSHGQDLGSQSEFAWTGLRDYSAILSLVDTLAFWDTFGVAEVLTTNHNLCTNACEYLSRLWETEILHISGSMATIRLPSFVSEYAKRQLKIEKLCYDHAEFIQDQLYNNKIKSIQVSIKLHIPLKNTEHSFLYVRICAHIYNTMDEYHHLGKTVLNMKSMS